MKKQGLSVDQIANQPIPSNMSSAYGQAADFGQLIYNEQTQASYAERRKLEDEASMYMQSVIDDIDSAKNPLLEDGWNRFSYAGGGPGGW